MKMNALNRFARLEFRNGKSLRNRVVVPPMASETADELGFVTDKTISHYSSLAKSQVGLVMVEYTYAHATGRSEVNQLGIQSDAHILGLKQIVKVIHASGALAGIQLTHSGGKTSRDLTGGVLMAPSQVPVPVKDQNMETPDAMSSEEIGLWKASFVDGVRRAEEAGFDLVEFHAAHGYGLNQWLSPITNKRSDSYGGTLANNSRMLFEVIEEVRRLHPALLFAVRMPGQDFLPGGLSVENTVWIAKELEKLGLDLIDVSSGIGGWRRPRDRTGEGYLVSEAAVIQSAISIPVIGVGGIEQGSFIDEALSSHKVSLAAVGRAILKEPEAWGVSNLHSKDSEMSRSVKTVCSSLLLLLFCANTLASAGIRQKEISMSESSTATERAKIEAVIQDYFQGYLAADSSLVTKAFHPETRLFSIEDGKLEKTEMSDWLKNIEDRKSKGDVRSATKEIVSIDITDLAAIAKVALTFPKYKFTDYLSLLQIQGNWRIIGKIYTVQELK